MTSELRAGTQVDFKYFQPITREQLRAYADASGDQNPIHLDEQAAKNVGLPGIIAHGMLIQAFIGERALHYVEEAAGCDWRLELFQARFKAMTLVGDTISAGGTVKSADNGRIELELVARNQRGDTVASAQVCFRK